MGNTVRRSSDLVIWQPRSSQDLVHTSVIFYPLALPARLSSSSCGRRCDCEATDSYFLSGLWNRSLPLASQHDTVILHTWEVGWKSGGVCRVVCGLFNDAISITLNNWMVNEMVKVWEVVLHLREGAEESH
jgi:hypothetical protein